MVKKIRTIAGICLASVILSTGIFSGSIVNASEPDEETGVPVTEEAAGKETGISVSEEVTGEETGISVSKEVTGEETEISDDKENADENRIETVDLSDMILQDGGLFEEKKSGSVNLRKYYALNVSQESVADAILRALQSREESLNVFDYGIKPDELKLIFQSVVNANPQLFYVYGGYSYSYSPSTGYVYEMLFTYDDAYSDADIEEFNRKVSSIKKNVQSDWSDEQKALYLHDYLVTNCTYDKSLSNYNAYGALVEGTSVCQGYALAYLYLLKEVGIDSSLVTSNGLNHAWNTVVIDGNAYFVDCTWDDPVGMYVSHCRHDNFLRSTQGMVDQGHSSTDWVYSDGTSAYGDCTGGRYDNCYWTGIRTAIRPVEDLWVYAKENYAKMDICAYDYSASEEQILTTVDGYIDEICNASYGNSYYYAIDASIYQLYMDGTVNVIYSLTGQEAEGGSICDLKTNENILTYYIYEDPYKTEPKGNGNVTLQARPVTISEVKDVAIGGRAADALRINWSKNDEAQGYIIEQSKNGKWSRIARIGNKNTVTYRVEKLSASTSCQFRIKAFAFDDEGRAVYSEAVKVSGKTLPAKTSGVKIGGRAADALRVNWAKNDTASGYIIEQNLNGVWSRVARIANKDTTTFRIETLTPSTIYNFRIQAFNFDGKTPLYGKFVSVSGKTNPGRMSGVVIGGKAKDALRINWTKNSSAAGYIIEQKENEKWVRIARIANPATTTYRIAGLKSKTDYTFRIRAFNFDGVVPLYGAYTQIAGKTN